MTSFKGELAIESLAEPACLRDGVIVAVRACGVCRSDLHAWNGVDPDVKLPHVMGHEMAGEVCEVGPDCRQFRLGDRVTAPFIIACGDCPACRAGEATICDDQEVIGFTYWGAFAERVAVPHADFNLVRLPDCLSFADAAGMGCRVTTAWRALADRAAVKPGEWVAVHGSGGVGLSAVMIARSLGARSLAIDIAEGPLEMAKALGADAVLNVGGVRQVGERVREMTDGGAHVSIDALGIAATFDNSLRGLRKLGRHVQVGMPVGRHATVDLDLLDLVYARQLSLHGMRGLSAAGFGPLLALIESGKFDPGALVSQHIALSAVNDALARLESFQGVGVTVIDDFAH
ncbi:MAG TPA: alcohol dehydrogenase catalytic domain-containing protein [Kiloniellaceae bacterium]|nr:alcohol dehydrogenase catalytic domain-containing protein [Kiloniellaceae bacterium]